MSDFRPKAYVKTVCPFSFKFRLFVTEAGLADQVEFIPMNPDADISIFNVVIVVLFVWILWLYARPEYR